MAQNESANPGGNRIGAMPAMITTTTRPAARRHSTEARGLMAVPGSPLFEGRFGRMFRGLPVFSQAESHLLALGSAMISEAEEEVTPEGEIDPEETTKPIPAGYTYLGQFIDHDLTFDPVSTPRPAERPGRADRLPHAALRPGQASTVADRPTSLTSTIRCARSAPRARPASPARAPCLPEHHRGRAGPATQRAGTRADR